MADYFLDTSAIVKRYVQEPGTAWVRTLAASASGNFIYLVAHHGGGSHSGDRSPPRPAWIQRGEANGALRLFRQDFAQDYRIAEITVPLLRQAALLADTHALRGYDAVQLAAALEVRLQVPALILVSGDGDLNKAAAAEGLPVENPNTHP